MADIELGLVEVRLARWSKAERHDRLGNGYPTASPIYRLMRDGTALSATPGQLAPLEAMTEFEQEVEQTQKAVGRLPDYLKQPVLLAYLDPRSTADKLPGLNMSERKFYDLLNCAKHRLVGLLLN